MSAKKKTVIIQKNNNNSNNCQNELELDNEFLEGPNMFLDVLKDTNKPIKKELEKKVEKMVEEKDIKNETVVEAEKVDQVEKVVKRKRGRPRINPKSTDQTLKKIPKKRGRKPKLKVISTENGTQIAPKKMYSILGKKTNNNNNSNQNDHNDSSNQNNQNNLVDNVLNRNFIVTLKISSVQLSKIIENCSILPIDKEISKSINNEPCSFNLNNNNNFQNQTVLSDNVSKELELYLKNYFNYIWSDHSITDIHKIKMPKIKIEDADFNFSDKSTNNVSNENIQKNIYNIDSCLKTGRHDRNKIDLSGKLSGKWIDRHVRCLLPEFKNKNNTWPDKSPYVCWNCTYNFDGSPIGIPNNIEGDVDCMDISKVVFHLYGNFCDTHCAARWLFDNEPYSSIWEKYSLLNILHSMIYGINKVVKVNIAPERNFLDKFGGYMSIEKYREVSCNKDCSYKVFKPPMVPILFQMEESISSTTNTNQDFIPIDKNKINQAEQKLRLNKIESENSYMTIKKCMSMIST